MRVLGWDKIATARESHWAEGSGNRVLSLRNQQTLQPFQVGCGEKQVTPRCSWVKLQIKPNFTEPVAPGSALTSSFLSRLLRTASEFNLLLSVRIDSNKKERENILMVKDPTSSAMMSQWNTPSRWLTVPFSVTSSESRWTLLYIALATLKKWPDSNHLLMFWYPNACASNSNRICLSLQWPSLLPPVHIAKAPFPLTTSGGCCCIWCVSTFPHSQDIFSPLREKGCFP